MRSVWNIAKAELKQRVRSPAYFTALLSSILISLLFLPKQNKYFQIMLINPETYLQGGNTTWTSISVAYGISLCFPVIFFFYLKSALIHDEKLGILNWIFSSPISKFRFFLGKFVSNILILYTLLFAVVIASFFSTIILFPKESLSLAVFLTPFIPFLFSILLISALALFYQVFPVLNSTFGSMIYLSSWVVLNALIHTVTPNVLLKCIDFSGLTLTRQAITKAIFKDSSTTDYNLYLISRGFNNTQGKRQLYFAGLQLIPENIICFLVMICFSILIVFVAACLYKFTNESSLNYEEQDIVSNKKKNNTSNETIFLTPKTGLRFNLLKQEALIIINNKGIFEYCLGIGLIISTSFVGFSFAVTTIVPLVFLWFAKLFSSIGSKEYQYHVLLLIETAPYGKLKQIFTSWFVGVFLSFCIMFPILIRSFISKNFIYIVSTLSVILFVPSLALFLGELFKNSKPFELVCIVTVYALIANSNYYIDSGINLNFVLIIMIFSTIMTVIAFIKRIYFSYF